ncbi:MAG TPA: hypothetical protein PK052_10320 [Anaerohalosphaeraceae bacterium]|nr:hypothetical protein [Phycisphaerae bacterium]HOK96263.1 hypothetical protein [Anaerohalosphaeraceae bacterium]HOL32364.1 hypothetical protein [Anaerohalosphaeraceae bacterium]HOM75117.1 hypothetical protein [Anaerohalosphaeraceae bacterium]HPC63426.1 hypothetical protein [Anaerohalosphaeraceae bacterium]
MRTSLVASLLLLAAGLIGGCAGSEKGASSAPLCVSDCSAELAMQAAQKVLTKMHFEIEKYDYDARYIRTRPLTGGQFFEIWRQDNASASAAAQANLHSLRRIVEMDFDQKGREVCIGCRVQVLRLSVPEQPLRGMGLMAEGITESSRSVQTLTVDPALESRIEWLDAGSDAKLEQRIVKRIERVIRRNAAQ